MGLYIRPGIPAWIGQTRCLPGLALMLLLATAGQGAAQEADIATLIVGSWICESGCWDEEVQFAIEDGERVYNSWLHARPSASGGSWSVAGNILSIQCCAGIEDEYEVLSVTGTDLIMRDTDSGEETLMKRFVDSPPPAPQP